MTASFFPVQCTLAAVMAVVPAKGGSDLLGLANEKN